MTDEPTPQCVECGKPIECCEFCDRPNCREAACFGCVHLRLGTITAEPHEHGG